MKSELDLREIEAHNPDTNNLILDSVKTIKWSICWILAGAFFLRFQVKMSHFGHNYGES